MFICIVSKIFRPAAKNASLRARNVLKFVYLRRICCWKFVRKYIIIYRIALPKNIYTKHWQQIVCFCFIFICLLALLWIGSFFGIKPMNHCLYPCPHSALHYYFLSWSLDSRTSFKYVKSWWYREIKNNKFVVLEKLPRLLAIFRILTSPNKYEANFFLLRFVFRSLNTVLIIRNYSTNYLISWAVLEPKTDIYRPWHAYTSIYFNFSYTNLTWLLTYCSY